MALEGLTAGDLVPRLLRGAAWSGATLALVAFFVYLGFPYGLLVDRWIAEVESGQPVAIRYQEVSAQPGWLGPGIVVQQGSVHLESGAVIEIDELFVRPAWSLGWLRGHPSIHLDAQSGDARLEAFIEAPLHLRGQLEDFDLSRLDAPGALGRADLKGRTRVDFDLRRDADAGWQGTAQLAIADGSFKPPDVGIAIPYERLEATLQITPAGLLSIESSEMEGKHFSGSASGTIQLGDTGGADALDLDFELKVPDRAIRNALRNNKIHIDPTGRGRIHFSGTLANPVYP